MEVVETEKPQGDPVAAFVCYDGAKKINGRKRHLVVDTPGLLLMILVTPADAGDRATAADMLPAPKAKFRLLHRIWADSGYTGDLITWAETKLALVVEIVKRTDDLSRFRVVPRRWVAERSLAELTRAHIEGFLTHQIACRKAGLLDGDGNHTVTAHRFRPSVGTQLAEGGAQIQPIMAILGHRSAQMSATYSHISDPVLKEQYEKVIAAGGRIAGPAAEAILASQLGEETVHWLKTNFFKTELELGHCLRTPAEGPCECDLYLRCSKFFTTGEYVPRLRERLVREHELVQDAVERGWPREVERHTALSGRICELLAELGESIASGTLGDA
ncbi:hypothetical protein GCM10009665_19560 [Kitasatospora nipponensis]|uniref:Phage integrase family protein n=1 Tax=Kitasatospora nipponensis TaxID=258049 RepID=A0ABN1W3B7_9ACTN